MPISDDQKRQRNQFATYLRDAMRAAGYVRSDGELDVPALSRMSGVADNILRRWLNEDGDPSLPNLRLVAPALGVPKRDLFVASGQVMLDEVGLTEEPQPPEAPSPEDRIMADDLLSKDEKALLIQTLRVLRDRNSAPGEPHRRKRA